MSLSPPVVAALDAAGLDPSYVEDLVRAAVAEDLAGGVDVTSAATVPADQRSVLDLVARAPGVTAGAPAAAAVFDVVSGGDTSVTIVRADGSDVVRGEVLLTATGRTRDLLTAERSALNLFCHLSGVATVTAAWAAALGGSHTRVRDTRKTTPGLRALEKYAVRAGGGSNHRFGLDDAVLVKDNHRLLAGGLREAVARCRAAAGHMVKLEVEVDTLDELDEALACGVDAVLLDNMPLDQLRQAVARCRGRALTEASGGLTPDNVRAVAETGVDLVSLGFLTHSAPALDVALDVQL